MTTFYTLVIAIVALFVSNKHSEDCSFTESEKNIACNLTVDAGPDITICEPGQLVDLFGTVNGNYSNVLWTPEFPVNNPNSLFTSATVNTTTTFTLTASGLDNTNLVFNGNFDGGLAGFTSDYIPGTGGPFGLLSNEGQFAVATNASDTHTNFAACSDHTGGGNMLVVNGAGITNQNVWCQVVNVTPFTDYGFSAWITSVVSSSPAFLQFSVSGVGLGTFNASPTTCVWNEFFQTWNSGPSSMVEICIVNQNTALSGNDFAIDDLFFGELCTAMDDVTVTLVQLDASWQEPTDLCLLSPPFDLNTLLFPTATPGGNWTIDGFPNQFFDPLLLGAGAHEVTYSVTQGGCTETNTLFIVVDPIPAAEWSPPPALCLSSPPVLLDNLLLPGSDPEGSWTINGVPSTVLDPSQLGAGFHQITYSVGNPPCINQQTQIIEISSVPSADWTPPAGICVQSPEFDLNTLLDPSTDNTGFWTINGNTSITFNPQGLGPGDFTVIYSVGSPDCQSSSSQTITVGPGPVANFIISNDSICSSGEVLVTFTGSATTNTIFNWDFNGGTAAPGSGEGPHTVSWDSNNTQTINLWTEEGNCVSDTVAQQVTVFAPIEAPVLSCGASSNNAVTVVWGDVPGADSYDLTVITNQTFTITGNSATIGDLSPGEEVQVYLEALTESSCPSTFSDTISCFAQDCIPTDITISPVDPICLDSSANLFNLEVMVSDDSGTGEWSGPGIVDSLAGTFDPMEADTGTHIITYTYSTANCASSATIEITVLPLPDAEFEIPDFLCELDTLVILFDGIASDTADFQWNFDGGNIVSGDGPGPYEITWNTPGIKQIDLIIDDGGCTSMPHTEFLIVDPMLATPVINCRTTNTSIEFYWDPIGNADDFAVISNGPEMGIPTSDTSFLFDNLSPLTEITIELTLINNNACPYVTSTYTCTAEDCPDITMDIGPVNDICLSDTSSVQQLTVVLAGDNGNGSGVWTGTGIIDTLNGIFDPQVAMSGEHTITYTYTEGVCQYNTSTSITVLPSPEAAFFISDDSICINETTTVNFDGMAGPNASSQWNFDGGMVESDSGMGPFTLSWSSPGLKVISLELDQDGCTDGPFTQTVLVDPLIVTPEVSCTSDYTSITFNWLPLDNVDGFMVNVLDGPPGVLVTDTSYQIIGLMPDQEIIVEVIALSNNSCPDEGTVLSCSTLPCPGITLDIDTVLPICFDGTNTLVDLSFQSNGDLSNGTLEWSGAGISDPATGEWTITPDMSGTVQEAILTYTETEEVCIFADTITFNINPVPNPSFDAPSIVCITDSAPVIFTGAEIPGSNYEWDFGNATSVTQTGPGPHELSFPSTGSYPIRLLVEANGCISDTTEHLIQVDSVLIQPELNCSSAYTSVTFEWNGIFEADDYTVLVSNGPNGLFLNDTTYQVQNLEPGQEVTIEWTATSGNACPDISMEQSCSALPCPEVSLTIDQVEPVCVGEDPIPLELDYQISGNNDGSIEWSGAGIIDPVEGIMEISQALAGMDNWVYVIYTEDVCITVDSFPIEVNSVPEATFTLPEIICITESATVNYLGPLIPGSLFEWNLDGGVADPYDGTMPFEVSWTNPGTYTISLTVQANGCDSETFSRTITVDPVLETPMITCESDYTTMEFTWKVVDNADSYEITLIPDVPYTLTSDTSLLIENLDPSTSVTIELTANSNNVCPPSISSLDCATFNCPDVFVEIEANNSLCEGETATLEFLFEEENPGPFTVTINNGNQDIELTSVTDGFVYDFLPTQSTTITFVSIINELIPACLVATPEPVEYNVSPTVEAGESLQLVPEYCNSLDSLVSLEDLIATDETGGYWVESSATPSTSFNPNTGTFNPLNQNSGNYTFIYVVESPSPCPNDSVAVGLLVHPTPVADAGEDQLLDCQIGMVTLGGTNTSTDSNLTYEWIASNGSMIPDPEEPFTEVNQSDTYILTVTNPETGCFSSDPVFVDIEVATPSPDISISPISCFESNDGVISVNAITGGEPPFSYSLNGNDFNNQNYFSNLLPGEYNLLIQDVNGCQSELLFELAQPEEIQVILNTHLPEDERIINQGDSLWIQALINIPANAIDTVIWSPDSLNSRGNNTEIEVSPIETSTYSVTVIDTSGCHDTDRVTIFVRKERDVFIPNVFSPNNDGINDIFMIFAGQQVREVKSFNVFNRWGESIFEDHNFLPNNPAHGWNGMFRGRPLNPAVFVFVTEIEMIDGAVVLFKGDVSLVK